MPPRVFISYSHDNPGHCDRVLALAQQLRRDGIAAELDQFHQETLQHWPRWCEQQMRPENADFVLCVCSAEYRRRLEGRAPADVGRGVFWEGRLLYNEIYQAKDNTRFVPVLLDPAGTGDIPAVLQGYSHFRLERLGLDDSDSAYAQLYRLLSGQAAVAVAELGEPRHLPALPAGERLTDFDQIKSELARQAKLARRRYLLLAAGLLLLLGIGVAGWWLVPQWTAQQVAEQFDPAQVAQRLRGEIQARFEQDADQARKAGENWQAIRQLEQRRDAALAQVDQVVESIREGLAGNPGPVFREASRLLQQQGSDAAIAYLESHRPDSLARAERAAALAETAQQRLQQELQPLLLQAELHHTRQEWDAELALLQSVAAKAPQWWNARRRLGTALKDLARYAEAETHLRAAAALAVAEADQAVALNDLAQLLQATNRLAEAEPLLRRALAIDEKSYGPEHPIVAIRLNNLAALLQATNRLVEAEPLMRRALAINEKSYGPEHLIVATALNNLATLLYATNRLAEAEPLQRRALAIDEKSYGPEHPDVARDLNNLAMLLQNTHRLAEAEPLLRRALAIDEKSYGPKHPAVAPYLNNLALLLQASNRLAEAEPLLRRALAIDEKSYGPEHPNVATRLNNLALLLQASNRLAEAEPLLRRALAIAEKSYGPEHPEVAIPLNNLAQLLQASHRPAEAEPLQRRALLILLQFTRATGHQHPNLQAAIRNYQTLLQAQHLNPGQIQARLAETGAAAGYGAEEWQRLAAGL